MACWQLNPPPTSTASATERESPQTTQVAYRLHDLAAHPPALWYRAENRCVGLGHAGHRTLAFCETR